MTKEALDKAIEAIKAQGRLVASASQIESYDLCHRKWAWRYIAKIRTPPNRWAALGLDVHKVLERFLKDGTPPDRDTKAGAIALPGLKFLPQPGAAIIEGKFLWRMPDEPFDIVGVIDWRDAVDGVPKIGDHKTTGDFKWTKTPDDLRREAQSTIYAAYTAYSTGAERILGRWVYYKTKGRTQAKCIDWKTGLTILAESFNRVLESGREMADWHRQKPEAEEVPYNPRGCDAYGGCPFRERCNLSSKERLVALMAQETLKEKMARKKAERAQAPAAAAPAAPLPPAAPAVNPPEASQRAAAPCTAAVPEQLSLKERMAARKKGRAPAAPLPPAHAVPTTAAPIVPSVPPALPPQPEEQVTVPAVDMQGFDYLYVDCAPIKTDGLKTIPASNVLAMSHSGDVGAYLDANPLPEGVGITMSLKTPEGAAIFEALSARASHVVRGF